MSEKQIQKIPLGELPLGIFEDAKQWIRSYSTVLIHNDGLAGSATFVKCGNKHGILTAHHVAFQCRPPFDFTPGSTDKLGIGVAELPHAFSIGMQNLVPHEIGTPTCDEFGPDLLFIEIPASSSSLQTILAKRQCWNTSVRSDERIAECYNEIGCVWATSGHPAELQVEAVPSHGFSEVCVLPGLVGITGVEAIHQRGEFDFFDTYVAYTGDNDIPQSCKGESGGGLWRIPISKEKMSDPNERMKVGNPVFAGVLFYQGPIENNRRLVRAHGAKSVYDVLRRRVIG
jgi:hypothetical protein